jgi:glycosyltransferase involved in cell wall biosynthesis
MLGDGACRATLHARAKAEGLNNILFIESVSKDQVVRYWSLLDASIVHLKKIDLFKSVIPSKLFECMGMGIPILHGVEGESADIVTRYDIGLTFEPQNANQLVGCLRRLRDETELRQRFAANGPLAASRYDRSVLARDMLAILNKCVFRSR